MGRRGTASSGLSSSSPDIRQEIYGSIHLYAKPPFVPGRQKYRQGGFSMPGAYVTGWSRVCRVGRRPRTTTSSEGWGATPALPRVRGAEGRRVEGAAQN